MIRVAVSKDYSVIIYLGWYTIIENRSPRVKRWLLLVFLNICSYPVVCLFYVQYQVSPPVFAFRQLTAEMVDIADVQDLDVWGERYSRDSDDLESRLGPTEKIRSKLKISQVRKWTDKYCQK